MECDYVLDVGAGSKVFCEETSKLKMEKLLLSGGVQWCAHFFFFYQKRN